MEYAILMSGKTISFFVFAFCLAMVFTALVLYQAVQTSIKKSFKEDIEKYLQERGK